MRLIAYFKLAKGLLLLLAGFGAFHLLGRDTGEIISHWVRELHVDPDDRHVHGVVAKLSSLSPARLKEAGFGAFFYAALLLTEGTGLLLRKRWAEYFTIIVTGSFIPLEVYEMVERLTFTRVALFIVNIAIVAYLVRHLKRTEVSSELR